MRLHSIRALVNATFTVPTVQSNCIVRMFENVEDRNTVEFIHKRCREGQNEHRANIFQR